MGYSLPPFHILLTLLVLYAFPGAHALTLFVQTPTYAGAPALVVWTRDTALDTTTQIRFDLRFVLLANAPLTMGASATATETPAATPSVVIGLSQDQTTDSSFVVQARGDDGGDSSGSNGDEGVDAGLALANIRLLAGSPAGSAYVFFPVGGRYVIKAVMGPDNTLLGTSNPVTVTDSPIDAPTPTSAPATLTGTSIATPTTAPALLTTTPSSAPTAIATPISAAASTKKRPNLPAIIGGILGALVILALLGILGFLFARRRALKTRRLTFHREWMVQGGNSEDNVARAPGHEQDEGTSRIHNTRTDGLLVPPSPFICVTPPPPSDTDLESGHAAGTPAQTMLVRQKLRVHTNTNAYPFTSNTAMTMPKPTSAAPPAMFNPNVAGSSMRQISSTPISVYGSASEMLRAAPIGQPPAPAGPRTPSSPFPRNAPPTAHATISPLVAPQLPPLNLSLGLSNETEGARKPPASAPALSNAHAFFPVRSASVPTQNREEGTSLVRAVTDKATAKTQGVINTIATRPASPCERQ